MWLIHAYEPPLGHSFSSRKRRRYLCGVVTVIVVNVSATDASLVFHTSASAAKAAKTARYILVADTAQHTRTRRRKRVIHVMISADPQFHAANVSFLTEQIKAVPSAALADIFCRESRLVFHAEAYSVPLVPLKRSYHLGIVGVIHGVAVLARKRGIFGKGVSYLLHTLKVIDVVHLYVKHDGNRGVEVKKRVHILARFKHKSLTFSHAISSVHSGKLRSRKHRRVVSPVDKHLGAH